MAVDSTPERSFSDLFSTSRAADATTGWTWGWSGVPRWLVAIIRRSVWAKERCGSERKVATRASVFRLVAASGAWLVGIGAVAGFALAFGVGMALRSLLIGVQPFDPMTYLAVLAILSGVALAACVMPARRAAGLDPLAALREE